MRAAECKKAGLNMYVLPGVRKAYKKHANKKEKGILLEGRHAIDRTCVVETQLFVFQGPPPPQKKA